MTLGEGWLKPAPTETRVEKGKDGLPPSREQDVGAVREPPARDTHVHCLCRNPFARSHLFPAKGGNPSSPLLPPRPQRIRRPQGTTDAVRERGVTPISIFPHRGGRGKRDTLTLILSQDGRGGKRGWAPAFAGARDLMPLPSGSGRRRGRRLCRRRRRCPAACRSSPGCRRRRRRRVSP